VETAPQIKDVVFENVPVLPPPDTRFGAIFWRTLRDNLVSILSWGLGYSALILIVVIFYPTLEKNGALRNVLGGLGLAGNLALGLGGVDGLSQFSAYLALEALTWAPLILAVYLIPQGMSAVAREEERGTLDILLSTPISRGRLLVEKTLGIVVSLIGILTIMWLTLVVSVAIVPEVELSLNRATAAIWHILPISLVILCVTLFLSVTIRRGRSAAGLAGLLVMGSYALRSVADITQADLLLFLKQFSFFSYYRSLIVLAQGFQPQLDGILLALAAILFTLTLRNFQRRDLGV
jgi:ABC-2 type transport system permease protein